MLSRSTLSRFRTALLGEGVDGTDLTPLQQHWIDYAMSTNDRGEAIVGFVESFVGKLHGKRWLDIGSGYGGLAIAAARRGAETTGVEFDQRLLDLAHQNLADHPGLSVRFADADILDPAAFEAQPVWDVITLDNVIEHVRSPRQMFQRFARLLAPDGLVYMIAPNGRSLAQVKADSHYLKFGVSLLDPSRGASYMRSVDSSVEYDVSWQHRRSEYVSLASVVGLECLLVNSVVRPGETERALENELALLREGIEQGLDSVPEELRTEVRHLVGEIISDCDAALTFSRGLQSKHREAVLADLQRDYLDEVWYFVIRWPGGRAPLPKTRGPVIRMAAAMARRVGIRR